MRLVGAMVLSILLHASCLWAYVHMPIRELSEHIAVSSRPSAPNISSSRMRELEGLLDQLQSKARIAKRVEIVIAPLNNQENDKENLANADCLESWCTIQFDTVVGIQGTRAQISYLLGHELGHIYYEDMTDWDRCSENEKEARQKRADRFALRLIGKDVYTQYLQERGKDDHEIEDYFAERFGFRYVL